MKELDLQTKIIDWVKDEGGYGRKLSHRFLVGIPDLLLRLSVPRSVRGAMVLAEVKLLKVTMGYDLGLRPKLGVTPRQLQELSRFGHSCVIVGVQRDAKLHSVYVLRNHHETFPSHAVDQGIIVTKGTLASSLTNKIMETIYD